MAISSLAKPNLVRAAAVFTAASYSRIIGANDKINHALIGCGGRGVGVLGTFINTGQVNVTAVCDVFSERVDEGQKRAPGAKGFKDHRKLLEAKDIDTVQIATPDHWHAAIAIDALNAGKDVYVEKPLTLKPEEGQPFVKAARVNNRGCHV